MSGDHLRSMPGSNGTISNNILGNMPIGASASSGKPTSGLSAMSLSSNHRYVKLNVGGRLFSTSIDTLTKQDNMLRAMFSGRMDVITDSDGYILIDRSGKHFELILNYLRDEDTQCFSMNLEGKSEIELYEMLKEAKFYCIQPLISMIEQKILCNKSLNSPEPYYGSSIVSMITSKNDLIKILSSTDKVNKI
jgi:BTB/POZ domain-containing adapter for CUL3-mediated RhoA degradation protein